MGRLVQLWKTDETEESVAYLYGPSKEKTGKLAISKKEKTVSLLNPVPDMKDSEEKFLYRDLAIIKLEMLASQGSFPAETHIAT